MIASIMNGMEAAPMIENAPAAPVFVLLGKASIWDRKITKLNWSKYLCCWKCPNLIINSENVRNVGLLKKAYRYVFFCAKGYFSRISWAL